MDFNISINATREKVWDVLFGETTYPLWTTAFAEGSKAETDWKKGSKAIFLDGNNKGLVARIAENVPNEYLSIEHLGTIDNGIEDLESEAVKKWAGAKENYTLSKVNEQTELLVSMEMDESEVNKPMIEMLKQMWPKALAKVKALAEEKPNV